MAAGMIVLYGKEIYIYTRVPWAQLGSMIKIVKFLRINGTMGESHCLHHEIIEFPLGTKKPNNLSRAYIGTWKNKLCLACLNDQQIRVWVLQEKHENEWVLEHCSVILCLNGYSVKRPPHIVGFHPWLNAVLILFQSLFVCI